MTHQAPTIHSLTPERRDDWLRFFEGAAVADNPRWRSCYCQFMYVDHDKVNWAQRSAQQNRTSACKRMACGRMQGLLAYREGQVVGWCNAAPRRLLDAYADELDPDAARLGHITCFVIAKVHRRSGVARALLRAACDMLREQGMHFAEATPSRSATTDAEHHHGPLALYLTAGFEVVRDEDDGETVVVRRRLAG